MSSAEAPVVGPRLHRPTTWFDLETAAVVTILLGLFQVLLSIVLACTDATLPKLFILPLFLGVLIMAGGSVTMACERNPSRLLLQGCACSNVVGLLGAVIAFCLYCYNLSIVHNKECPVTLPLDKYYGFTSFKCPTEILQAYAWSVTLLLLLYDTGAVVLHSALSFSALKALKTD